MFSSLGVVVPFDRHHRLVTSPLYSARKLAFQRLVFAMYSGATLITSLVYESVVLQQGHIWFSYFTHLSYIGLSSYLLASVYHGFNYKPSSTSSYSYPLQRWPKVLQASHLLLQSTITTFPFLVTICYWALISSSATFATRFETWTNISLHILNIVYALFEIFTTNLPPLPWTSLPVCLVLLLAYLGVAYITYASQGVYTYAFLDPQTQHSKLAAYISGIAIGEIVVFVLVHYAIVLRDRISKFALYHNQDTQEQGSKEALDDWEEVQWNDGECRESAGSSVGKSMAEVRRAGTTD